MDIANLHAFIAIAETGSFSLAAEQLHLTQPAVSIQIRQIVETIGLSLFAHDGREIALTSAGEELLATVRQLDDVWNRFESAIDELKGLKRGKICIGLAMTSMYFLPRMLGASGRVERPPGVRPSNAGAPPDHLAAEALRHDWPHHAVQQDADRQREHIPGRFVFAVIIAQIAIDAPDRAQIEYCAQQG